MVDTKTNETMTCEFMPEPTIAIGSIIIVNGATYAVDNVGYDTSTGSHIIYVKTGTI